MNLPTNYQLSPPIFLPRSFRLKPKHRHKWTTTRTNPYQIPTEQQCTSCQTYRHHTAQDLIGVPMGGEPNWKPGRHPEEIKTTNSESHTNP